VDINNSNKKSMCVQAVSGIGACTQRRAYEECEWRVLSMAALFTPFAKEPPAPLSATLWYRSRILHVFRVRERQNLT